jgi:hypothetical protein
VARAKRTDRADARRRHRAELAAQDGGEPAETSTTGAASTASTADRQGPPRPPGITNAFRQSFTPLDVRGDLAALPMLLRHKSFYIPAALSIGATILAFATNSSLEPGTSTEGADILTIMSVFAFQYFVVAPPVGSAFLAGFLAPRASWLVGFLVGIVALICLAAIVYSPLFGELAAGDTDPRPSYVANAAAVAPLGSALFASAAAWYRRFLNLANPNRGQRPPARGSGRRNDRPVRSRTSPRRR